MEKNFSKFKYYKSKVLIIGYGKTGKSIAYFLKMLNCDLSYWDDAKKSKNINGIKRLNKFEDSFKSFKYVFASPGIPKSHEIIKKFLKIGYKVISDLELYFEIIDFLKIKRNIIAITGTNGKSTVALMIAKLLKQKPLANYGNLVLENIPKKSANLVLELSSFQLDYISKIRPHISVITNLEYDHLSYHGSYKNYFNTKLKITTYQKKNDYLLLNYDNKFIRKFFLKESNTLAKIVWVSTKQILENGVTVYPNKLIDNFFENQSLNIKTNIFLQMEHNRLNYALSYSALRIFKNLKLSTVLKQLSLFKGLPHRIEMIGKIKNIFFYNDSKATNLSATCSALESFNQVILIAGGSSKGESFNTLKKFEDKIFALYLFGETASEISQALRDIKNNFICKDLEEAVKKSYIASIRSKKGVPILLSPACASFDHYKDYKERGRHFKSIFTEIKSSAA